MGKEIETFSRVNARRVKSKDGLPSLTQRGIITAELIWSFFILLGTRILVRISTVLLFGRSPNTLSTQGAIEYDLLALSISQKSFSFFIFYMKKSKSPSHQFGSSVDHLLPAPFWKFYFFARRGTILPADWLLWFWMFIAHIQEQIFSFTEA